MPVTPTSPCPCGSGYPYRDCCAPFISTGAKPATAEALMRSRYSAYVTMDADYLLRTWHPDTRPKDLVLDHDAHWLGLKVKTSEAGGPETDNGTVEFVARFKVAGRGYRLHEVSRFQRLQGCWVYIDGEQIEKPPHRIRRRA